MVQVDLQVKPDCLEAFISASMDNANSSRKEPGVVRFDIFQEEQDSTRFEFIEVYRTAEDMLKHRETRHFQQWRKSAEHLLEQPRTRKIYRSISPMDSDW